MKVSKPAIIGLSVVILALAVFFVFTPTGKATGKYDDFAKCLTDSGVTFYGAWWCPHCQNQKKMFGSSFEYLNQIECEKVPNSSRGVTIDACKQANITGYPTWIFNDGTRVAGEMSFQQLSEKTGCEL